MIRLLFGVVLLLKAYEATERSCSVTIQTDSGKVRGLRRDADGYAYYSFRNVTFAKQPVGALRFQELQPPEPWDDVADATEDGPICPQDNIFYNNLMTPSGMDEACVHASVHVPVNAPIQLLKTTSCRPSRHLRPPNPHTPGSQKGLPIFVFVHGGGFSFGSGHADLHGPEYLVRKGVIVVTFNYRLRAFGFLSLNSSRVPGNAGVRDVVTVLKWVKKNAISFGGDPDKITLGGQSAGAAITHLLSLDDKQDLFQRAIMMSGTASRSFYSSSPINAERMATFLTLQLGLNYTDKEETYNALINTPVETIGTITNLLRNVNGFTDYTPVVESKHKNVKAVIKIDPDDGLNAGAGNRIPKIIGFTDNECFSFKNILENINILERIKENPATVVPVSLLFQLPPEKLIEVAQEIMTRYFKGEPTMDEYLKLCSDSFFIYPTLMTVDKSEGDVYMYRFGYVGGGSKILQDATGSFCDADGGCIGASHVEDIMYIFKANSYPDYEYTPSDITMQDWITTMYTNFIKNGKPTMSSSVYNQWLPVNRDKIKFLDIRKPLDYKMVELDEELLETKYFFNKLYNLVQKTE